MFNEKLCECRNKRGLSQTAVAKMLNITRQAYNHYETGQRQPTQEVLVKLADIFEVSVDYLLGRTDTVSDDITFDDFTYALHNETQELSEADKQMLLEMAKMLKKRTEEKEK